MDVTSVWWSFPPYTNSIPTSGDSQWPVGGVIGEEIPQMLNFCKVKTTQESMHLEQVTSPNLFDTYLSQEAQNSTLTFHYPFSRSLTMALFSDPDLYFLPLIESPGSVYFYKAGTKPVGSDLITVLVEGWPMIILILLGASYAGIIIWLLDRLWNPTNFPRPFIRGFWEGFWWAFVTMTTVGYGDTTPRSIQARIFGLIWIIIGVTILSVFTATVTTVMTQQAVSVLQTLQGRRIAAINGSEDFNLAISKGATVIVASTLEEMSALLMSERVDGALLDYYSVAGNLDQLSNMVVEGTMQHSTLHGIMVRGGDKRIYGCLRRYVEANHKALFMKLTAKISHAKLHIALESAHGLFQPKTINYMLYCLAAWVVIFLGFVLWEFVYWRPKHKLKKQEKSRSESLASVEAIGGDPKPEADGRATSTAVVHSVSPLVDIPISYTNSGFVGDHSPRPTWPKQRPSSSNYPHQHLSGLDHLIHTHNAELLALEEEFVNYKRGWEKRLSRTKARHRKEQISFIRTLQTAQTGCVENGGTSDSFLYVTSQSTLFNSNSFRLDRTSVNKDGIVKDNINYL